MAEVVKHDLFGDDIGEASLTHLDPQQTSQHHRWTDVDGKILPWPEQRRLDRLVCGDAGTCIAAEVEELNFRHRGWAGDRRRVRVAMVAAGLSARRIERFDNCGAACRIEVARDGSRVRVKAQYCGDRWCVPCCTGRSINAVANLTRLAQGHQCRLVTLTARPAGETLAECYRHVASSFGRLRATKWWGERVRGGAAVFEITRGGDGGHWHVHVHCVCTGGYIDHRELREQWRVASRGSYIVDVRLVRDDGKAIRYVAKYATKGWGRGVLANPEHAAEAMRCLTGRRLISTFGDWFNADVEAAPADTREYVTAGSLVRISRLALNGDPWALSIMMALRVRVVDDCGRAAFAGPDSS